MTEEIHYNEALGQFNLLFEQNKGLILHTLKGYNYFYDVLKLVDYDDLYQEASLAFYKTYLAYDPSKGTAFTTICVTNMKGYVLTYIRDKAHVIRKSVNAIAFERICNKNNINHISQLSEYEKEFTNKNILLNLAKELFLAYSCHRKYVYLDSIVGDPDKDTETLVSFLDAPKDISFNFNIPEDIVAVLKTLGLSERENTFVALRAMGYTLQSISDMTGVSKTWVSKVLKGVEDTVRQGVYDYYGSY